tara:strand:- start:182 stop:688 length:507 start_codon:yes stop_codon:yes gene_type:complete
MNVGKNIKSMKKSILNFNTFLLLGILILIVVLFKYNNDKVTFKDSMTALSPQALNVEDESEHNYGLLQPGVKVDTKVKSNVETNPTDLLPKTGNDWGSNAQVTSDLKNINLLNAGANYGINTVGSSLRNPNLQIRSEPIIPKTQVGPWNNTTIEADNQRRSLEIDGCD